jgi:hypothetical protein
MGAHFINKQFSQVIFAGFLGITTYGVLNLWRPRYSTFYCMSNVKRL